MKNQTDAIRNQIMGFDKRRISQPKTQWTNQPWIREHSVFHFLHPVEKDSKKHHKLTQNSVSFSCQSKQLSRCCINFTRELTCQILTNQSIIIRRGAWPWLEKLFPACILKTDWIFVSEVSLNHNSNSAWRYWQKHNIFDMNLKKKVNMSLQSFENE